MKILYDYQAFIQRYGGVSRYAVELISHLSKDAIPVLPKIWTDNVYFGEKNWKSHSFLTDKHFCRKYQIYKFLNILQSVGTLHREEFDIFHPLFVKRWPAR